MAFGFMDGFFNLDFVVACTNEQQLYSAVQADNSSGLLYYFFPG